ncbi:MAG: hypothetical protein RL318_2595, partial [Fibrobacterota bacterium]
MKTMTGILALAGSAALAAPQVSVQARTDYRYDLRSQADETLRDNNGFDLQYARLDVNGAVAPSLKYRMRLRFDFPSLTASTSTNLTTKDVSKVSTAKTTADSTKAMASSKGNAVVKDSLKGASDYVDYLFAKQSLPMGFSVTAGKFFSGRCGWEGEAAGYDLYQTTQTYASSSAMHSVVGVQPAWEGAGQTVSMTVANSGVGWTDAANKDVQHFLLFGAAWKGTFLEGLVQPNISLFYVPVKSMDDARYLTTVGIRSKYQMIQTDIEWKSLADTAKMSGNLPFTQSWSAMVKADLGMMRPQLKFFYDNVSVLDEKKSLERIGITPVLEVFPFEKTNFRWHAGYSMLDVIPKGSKDKVFNKIFL